MKFGKLSTDQAKEVVVVQAVPFGDDEGNSEPIVVNTSGKAVNLPSHGGGGIKEGELDADMAAKMVAAALVICPTKQGVVAKRLSFGQINIVAQRAGLVELDVDRITAMGRMATVVTCATVANHVRVVSGTVVATIKVVSTGVDMVQVTGMCSVIGTGDTGVMRIRPAVRTTATLIETLLPGGRVAPSGRRILDERLDRLGARLVQVEDTPHDSDAVAKAIQDAEGEIIVLLSVTATTRLDDVVPSALLQVGGQVDRLGIPVNPGYSGFIGSYRGRPVIGMPASARSLALNGVDWVLERIVCGLSVSNDTIAALAIGGLLNDGHERGPHRG